VRFRMREGFHFHGDTKPGDCGSLLVIHQKSIPRKFLAIHNLGSYSGT